MSIKLPKRKSRSVSVEGKITKCKQNPDGSVTIEGIIPLHDVYSCEIIPPEAIKQAPKKIDICDENDCEGCTCHRCAPCTHCVDDHDNIDGHPICVECGIVLRDGDECDCNLKDIKPQPILDQNSQPLSKKTMKYIKNDNPHLPKEYIEHVVKSASPEEYEKHVMGKFPIAPIAPKGEKL